MPDLLYLSAATMRHAVTEAIANVALTEADTAAAVLAFRLAGAIDDAEDQDAALAKHGPKLLDVLKQLRATPASRTPQSLPQPAPAGRLQQLREERG